MSPDPHDFSKTLLFQGAVRAASFRRMVTGLMVLFISLSLLMLVGHSVAPAYVGPVPPSLLRTAGLFALIWFVFNGLWALIDHLVTSLVRASIEGLAFALVKTFETLSASSAEQKPAPASKPTTEAATVSYMTDFLKDRLDKLNTDPKGAV